MKTDQWCHRCSWHTDTVNYLSIGNCWYITEPIHIHVQFDVLIRSVADFCSKRTLFMCHWVDQWWTYFKFKDKNAVNQAFQYTREKLLIDWQICNRWWLRWRKNLNLVSNDGLRMSRTNEWLNDQVDDQTNEDWESLLGENNLYMNYSYRRSGNFHVSIFIY